MIGTGMVGTRIPRRTATVVLSLLGATLALAAFLLGYFAQDAQARVPMTLCSVLRPASANADAVPGATWAVGSVTSRDWYLLADTASGCREALRLLPEISRRIVSHGTVDQIAFGLDGGWSCTASRSFAQGGCSVLGAKGQARYIIAIAATYDGGFTQGAIMRGTIDVVLMAPRPTSSAPSAPTAPTPVAAPAVRCTNVQSKPWVMPPPDRVSGDRWQVYALGGLPCLAAQGWVFDVAPQMPGQRTVRGGRYFIGDNGWQCHISAAPLQLGVCVRATDPRGPLDFRGVIVVPNGFQRALRDAPAWYEAALGLVLASKGNVEFRTRRVACDDRVIPGARWTLGKESGTRWIIGTDGGYPCTLVLGPMLAELGRWAATLNLHEQVGVYGEWRCSTQVTEPGLRCVRWNQRGLQISVQPYRSSLSHAENVADLLHSML